MKVLAVASAGGHWLQLLRLKPAFDYSELVFISTRDSFSEFVPESRFYAIRDFSRKNKIDIIRSLREVWRIVASEKPDVILTTGAAPGLIVIIVGALCSCKTIWVDSIANVEKLSLSGKIASVFADRVYTQWPHLASKKVIYAGNVIS
ncbi:MULTISPECIES: hypothetical protein [Dysgonomonas]|uniref:Oligosaccharide biosynthesis protein Alg14 n=1 Tax=Dysgonomonas gadei ATCC BAA-286 TaxID=742766 RepID=F5IUP8_9BACT|nr:MULTISPECIES: hypothetical protein [Dysgonomonas]EGK02948.1 hypothetical protein HMPREF9455_01198 [Dysgonomonas gadei ATCC BAA-286]MBF0648773.1 oligosaccharide biosynthesis protein Alg14 [Dysgonomonas sp. GY75]